MTIQRAALGKSQKLDVNTLSKRKEAKLTNEKLCLCLMRADTEDEVVTLLRAAGYWENDRYWRYFGDTDNNFGSIGNQQREPVAALIEKIVNGVDARLMNECLIRGIDPTSDAAPIDMRILFPFRGSFSKLWRASGAAVNRVRHSRSGRYRTLAWIRTPDHLRSRWIRQAARCGR